MKNIISLEGGALVIAEQSGDFFLNLDGSLGGGSVAGWLSGSVSIKLGSGTVALKAAEAFINHLLPAATQPLAVAIEGYINAAVGAL